jgi:hypothetical protein
VYIFVLFQLGRINLQDQAATNRPEEDALVWRLEEKSSEFTLFDFSEILHATCNFSKENLLGRGGFGPVYKVNCHHIFISKVWKSLRPEVDWPAGVMEAVKGSTGWLGSK